MMATLQTDESNILDAETINWRLIVYPILVALVVVAGGFGIYYEQLLQRDKAEDTARTALQAAKTPEDLVKVADQNPGTDQAIVALLAAGDTSFLKHDYAAAIADYQRILGTAGTNSDLLNSAQIGLASALEASGKTDDAIKAYLDAAQLGAKNPFAPYAYSSAAHLYDHEGKKDKQREMLTEESTLDPDSSFVKEAQLKLKQMTAEAQPPLTVPVPAQPSQPQPPISVNIAPAAPGKQ